MVDLPQSDASQLCFDEELMLEYQSCFEPWLQMIESPPNLNISSNESADGKLDDTNRRKNVVNIPLIKDWDNPTTPTVLSPISSPKVVSNSASTVGPVTFEITEWKTESALVKYNDHNYHDRLPDYFTCTALQDQSRIATTQEANNLMFPRSPQTNSKWVGSEVDPMRNKISIHKLRNRGQSHEHKSNQEFIFSMLDCHNERCQCEVKRGSDDYVVFIRDLSVENTYQSLFDIFQAYGEIKEIFLNTNSSNLPYGHVKFREYRSILDVIANRNVDPSLAKFKLSIKRKPYVTSAVQ